MPLIAPTSTIALDAVDASWMHQPATYLTVATVCLVVALHFLKQALAPIGALIQAAVAAVLVTFAVVVAVAMLIVAALTTAR